tara:strand:- start:214 stop:777 length:564 start_codon:yes stop_codon:yes gene_type:complete
MQDLQLNKWVKFKDYLNHPCPVVDPKDIHYQEDIQLWQQDQMQLNMLYNLIKHEVTTAYAQAKNKNVDLLQYEPECGFYDVNNNNKDLGSISDSTREILDYLPCVTDKYNKRMNKKWLRTRYRHYPYFELKYYDVCWWSIHQKTDLLNIPKDKNVQYMLDQGMRFIYYIYEINYTYGPLMYVISKTS